MLLKDTKNIIFMNIYFKGITKVWNKNCNNKKG